MTDWTDDQRHAFSDLFRSARARLGLTQAELARQVGVDKGTVVGLEGGPYAGMRTPDVLKLAAFLGIDYYELAGALGIEVPTRDGSPLASYEAAVSNLNPDEQELVLRTLDALLRGLQRR